MALAARRINFDMGGALKGLTSNSGKDGGGAGFRRIASVCGSFPPTGGDQAKNTSNLVGGLGITGCFAGAGGAMTGFGMANLPAMNAFEGTIGANGTFARAGRAACGTCAAKGCVEYSRAVGGAGTTPIRKFANFLSEMMVRTASIPLPMVTGLTEGPIAGGA